MIRALLVVVAMSETEAGRGGIQRTRHLIAINGHRLGVGRHSGDVRLTHCQARARVSGNCNLNEQNRSHQESADGAAKGAFEQHVNSGLRFGRNNNKWSVTALHLTRRAGDRQTRGVSRNGTVDVLKPAV